MKTNTFLQPYGFFINTDQVYFNNSLSNIELDIEISKKKGFIPSLALMMQYGMREMTLVIIYKSKELEYYPISCFFEFTFEDLNNIRNLFRKKDIKTDIHEIDYPLGEAKQIELAIYNNLMLYFDNKSMWK